MSINIPNLFVIGAPKCGTTALVNALDQHPDVYVPSKKEPRYFDAPTFYDYAEDYPIKSINEYLILYETVEAKQSIYRVDGSVFNMYSLESVKNILKLSPDAKFIVILRDPLSASKSMHNQRLKYPAGGRREISEDFCECWKSIEMRKHGKMYPKKCRNTFLFRYDLIYSYELYIPKILDIVPSKNIYIDNYHKLKYLPESFYKNLFTFLNLNNNSLPMLRKINSSFVTKPSYSANIFYYLAQKTLNLRKSLGLTGNKVNRIKHLLYQSQMVNSYSPTRCDEDVQNFFKNTYSYMHELVGMSK